MAPNIKMIGAIDLSGFDQFIVDGQVKLTHQENVKGVAEKRWNDQRQIGADPADFGKQDILRDHRHKARNHHGRQDEGKDQIFSWKGQFCKPISNEGI